MDEEIHNKIKAGLFLEAFELIVTEYQAKIFRLALGILNDESTAKDMVQETLIKVWKALPNFRLESKLSTWIYAIARNTCYTEAKHKSLRVYTSLDSPEGAAISDSLVEEKQDSFKPGDSAELMIILDKLPDNYRTAVTLFYIEQKSYEEAAELLGQPVGTFKTWLFRARKMMVSLMKRLETQEQIKQTCL